VSTVGSVTQQGSATIGGNGLAPVVAAVEPRIEQAVPLATVPATPEEVFGLPAGALDEYKVSALTTPFHGIVYVTADHVGPVHFTDNSTGEGSSGILIVHNASRTAELQIRDGEFKGLIITDEMDKFDGDAELLGCTITLSDSEVSTFGTGNARLFYSPQILSNLRRYCSNLRRGVETISWKEGP
jgi:hypothetical protein